MTNCWVTNILDSQPRQMRNSGHKSIKSCKCRHFPLDPFFLISQEGNKIPSLAIVHLLYSKVTEVKKHTKNPFQHVKIYCHMHVQN